MNLSILGMITVDAAKFYMQLVNRIETEKSFYLNLAEELMDYQDNVSPRRKVPNAGSPTNAGSPILLSPDGTIASGIGH